MFAEAEQRFETDQTPGAANTSTIAAANREECHWLDKGG
jgi:hypothetical protein